MANRNTSANNILGTISAAKIFTSKLSETKALNAKEGLGDDAEKSEVKKSLFSKKTRSKIDSQKDNTGKKESSASKFLTTLAKWCDIGKKELITWIATVITYILPAIEIAVKALLLTNLKKMIDCSLDVRIPDKLREEGLYLNSAEIDPRGILDISPYVNIGKYNYFGVFEGEKAVEPYELCRALDFNAFLWYAKTRGYYASPLNIEDEFGDDYNISENHVISVNEPPKYLAGCTFCHKGDSNNVYLLAKVIIKDNGAATDYILVPVSSSWKYTNYFVANEKQIGGLESKYEGSTYKSSEERLKNCKEKPIFSVSYVNTNIPSAQLPSRNFHLKILPKPYLSTGGFIADLGNSTGSIIDSAIENGPESFTKFVSGVNIKDATKKMTDEIDGLSTPALTSFVPRYALFNESGEYDSKGCFSFDSSKYIVTYDGKGPANDADEAVNGYVRLKFTPKNGTGSFYVYENPKGTGAPFVIYSSARSHLVECYKGLTVYEFNYDYVMSLKLFDASVIASNIINSLMGVPLFSIKLNLASLKGKKDNADQILIDSTVDKMIENILASEDEEYTDCFYTFSNKQYQELERKATEKAINGSPFMHNSEYDSVMDETFSIMDNYNADSTLAERANIIEKSITSATELIEGDANSSTSTNIGVDSNEEDSLLESLYKTLITAIVNSLLTPKVLMLIQVNKRLTQGDITDIRNNYENYNLQSILNGLSGVISSIAKEVIDMIQKELLKLILSRISELFNTYTKQLAKEYIEKWKRLLRAILSCIRFGKGNGGISEKNRGAIESAIDAIETADIDSLQNIIPDTNACD